MDVAKYKSTTPDPFKFVLESEGKEVICNESPIGWDNGVMGLTRRIETAGVTQSYLVDSLTFVGNAANFITEKFEEKEANAEMTLEVHELRPLSMSYVPFSTKYKLVFSSYKTVKVGEFNVGVQIDLLSSGFVAKYDDRKNVKLDLTLRTALGSSVAESLGGMEISEFLDFPDKSLVTIPEMSKYDNGFIRGGYLDSVLPWLLYRRSEAYNNQILRLENPSFRLDGGNPGYAPVELIKGFSTGDFSEFTTQAIISNTGVVTRSELPSFFTNSLSERQLRVNYKIMVNVTNRKRSGDNAFNLYIGVFDNNNNLVSEQSLVKNADGDNGFGKQEHVYILSSTNDFGTWSESQGEKTITVNEGHSVKMYFKVEEAGFAQGWTAYFNKAEVTIQETIVAAPEVIIEGLPVYEAMKRACQKVFDDENPFYSDKFNRVDLGAATEDNKTFGHIMSGVNIRGLPLSNNSGGINISLEELLQGVDAIWCTGHSIEYITDRYKLRVEDYSYFFNSAVILDVSDRVNELDISTEYMPDLGHVEILAGYQSYVYRSTNGRSEYNTEATKTTQLNTPNKLDLKCIFRADTTGFINCLMMPIDLTGSEDIEEDNDVFILKTQKDGDNWIAEKEENIQIVDNSSLFAGSSLNLFFTPSRNLIRNSLKYTPALQKMRSSNIKHQTSNKYQNLRTTGEGYTITENDDILVNTLPTPLFRPIQHNFECLLTNSEFRMLNERGIDGVMNYLKLIKFTSTKYGWIMDLEKQLNNDKGTFTLIEKL